MSEELSWWWRQNHIVVLTSLFIASLILFVATFTVPFFWRTAPEYFSAEILSGAYYESTLETNTSLMLIPGSKGQISVIPITRTSGSPAHGEMVLRLSTGEIISFETDDLRDIYNHVIGDIVRVEYTEGLPFGLYERWEIVYE